MKISKNGLEISDIFSNNKYKNIIENKDIVETSDLNNSKNFHELGSLASKAISRIKSELNSLGIEYKDVEVYNVDISNQLFYINVEASNKYNPFLYYLNGFIKSLYREGIVVINGR